MLTAGTRSALGADAAGFLDIPAGGRPAALGGAYTAVANDAYAPVWNPAGLSRLPSPQLGAAHVSYLQSLSYEFVSLVTPLRGGQGLGLSAQILRPGTIGGADANGASEGGFGGHYAAYAASYGRRFGEKLSLGAALKLVEARIADVSARTSAVDVGGQYRMDGRLTLGVAATNIGGSLRFIEQEDPLTQAFKLAAAYQARPGALFALEGVRSRDGEMGVRAGGEYRPAELLALRVGVDTTLASARETARWGGLTAGIGLSFYGQRFDFAWVPRGELGDTHYFSILIAFGRSGRENEEGKPAAPAPDPNRKHPSMIWFK